MNFNADTQSGSHSKDKSFVGTRRKQEQIKNKEEGQKFQTQFYVELDEEKVKKAKDRLKSFRN